MATDTKKKTREGFSWEYAQLHVVQQDARELVAEGPVLISHADGDAASVLKIGLPEEKLVTWQLQPRTPTLKVAGYTFMFAVEETQSFYAVDFAPETPSEVLAAFEKVLQANTEYAVSPGVPQNENIPDERTVTAESGKQFKTSSGTADRIRRAGTAIANGITAIGEQVGNGIIYIGDWYRRKYVPNEEPTKIDPKTMSRIESVKGATHAAARIANSVAGAVGSVVGYVAHGAARVVRSTGLVDDDKSGPSHTAAQVGKAAVLAAVEVFDAMHIAGRGIVTTGVDQTATCVEYRYGEQAGTATRNGMGIGTDAYDVYGSYRALRKRAVMKAFAMGTVSGLDNDPSKPAAKPDVVMSAPAPQMLPATEDMNTAAPSLPAQATGGGQGTSSDRPLYPHVEPPTGYLIQ